MPDRPGAETPDLGALVEGIRNATLLYINEADLRLAVGETGQVIVEVTFQLEHGRVQWSKGGCHFARRISYRGG